MPDTPLMTVTFTVHGPTGTALEAKALTYLYQLIPDAEWRFTIHAEPAAQTDTGTITEWQGEVHAETGAAHW